MNATKNSNLSAKKRKALGQALTAKINVLGVFQKELKHLNDRMIGAGIDHKSLPIEVDRQAFCLLGDHQRPETLNTLLKIEGELLDKGIILCRLNELSTPALRMLVAAMPHFLKIQAIRERIDVALSKARAQSRLDFDIHLPKQPIHALDCQTVMITGRIVGSEWLLITPAPVFGVSESLLCVQADQEFEVEIGCSTGQIVCAALNIHGEAITKTINLIALPAWHDSAQTI